MSRVIGTLLFSFFLASSSGAAPALQDKKDWLNEVIDQPAEKRPWTILEKYVDGKQQKDWIDDGFRLHDLLKARAKKLSWKAPMNEFTLVEDGKKKREEISPTAMSVTLMQFKWWELNDGKPATLIPKGFPETGRKK